MALFKRESEELRAIVDDKAIHILDKKTGAITTWRLTEEVEDIMKGEDWKTSTGELSRDGFEELWQKAEESGKIFVEKVISGGQTGADRGGMDAAIALNDYRKTNGGQIFELGGWCPRNRKAEDGKVPDEYPLIETKSASFMPRTRKNVEEADATLVFVDGGMSGGSLTTVEHCKKKQKLHLVIELSSFHVKVKGDLIERTQIDLDQLTWLLRAGRVRNWLAAGRVKTLNIAGSRESKSPGIQHRVGLFMVDVLR